MEHFEEYPAPERSRLERHFELIREPRSKNWPFHAIRRHLASRHGLQITVQGIHKFCRTRNIRKGRGEHPPAEAPVTRPRETTLSGSLPGGQAAQPPVPPAAPLSQPEAHPRGKAMTREEMDVLKARVAREVAEADAAKAAKDAKWNFAAAEAEIFRAATPGYDRP